jgi:nitrogen fixation NifU-like protein
MKDFDINKRDVNISCGDDVEIFIKLDESEFDHKKKKQKSDDRIIRDIKFQGTGCVICMATASILTEELLNKKISEVKSMNTDEVLNIIKLKLTPTRVKCAMLPLVTIKKGILDFEAKILNEKAKD